MEETAVIPIQQWTHDIGEVLVVRFVGKDGKSAAKRLKDRRAIDAEPFQHPMTVGESVTAPDWDASPVCGGGIHGWPWAMNLGDGKDCDWSALWQVYAVKPEDIVFGGENLTGKVKFRTGILRHLGTWESATNFVLAGQMAWVHYAARGAASATGTRGAASATGKTTAAVVTGTNGKARAGEFGMIALAWWNEKESRAEMRCARTGAGCKCKPDVWYRLDAKGNFVEAGN